MKAGTSLSIDSRVKAYPQLMKVKPIFEAFF